MLPRLRTHVRHNVVGYLALFFALTGVAYAAGPLKVGDPAGGDLTGTYPNPTIASGAVDTANFSGTIPAARVFGVPHGIIDDPFGATLAYAVENYDTADLHSTTENTSRLTAPVAGVYQVSAQVSWQPDPDGNRGLAFTKNGANLNNTLAPGAAVRKQALSTELKLAAGDYVEVIAVNQGAGEGLFVTPDFFTMSWVAPG